AAAGDAEADWQLACFRGGARDERYDPEAAHAHLERAASRGHGRALTHLAHVHLRGLLAPPDPRRGHESLRRAVEAGDPGAFLLAAECLASGVVFPRNPDLALALARAAAERGWELAADFARELEAAGATAKPGPLPAPAQRSDAGSPTFFGPRLEVLSWRPRLVALHDFAGVFECAEIVNAAREHVMPSFIVDGEGRLGKHEIRTSLEVRLRPGIRNVVINAVERRMADWSHVPVEHGEYPLVLRYENEQSFEQHYDYFIPEKFVMGEGPLQFGGQRLATQLLYLNDGFEGGETRFDLADIAVKPRRGLCILFYNLGPDHNVDPLTRHTGVAVSAGVKWLLSRWIRELPHDQAAAEHPRDRYKTP
ncbi:MAG: 2OG-Fe(II) oxygenase, partial [Gammaproteobacteria bacterium]